MRPTNFPSRRGFSFTEVLFAVMVLGIGFIMIAAIFPVAIQQSKTTTEETVGSTIVRGAVSYMQSIATDVTLPPTGAAPSPVVSFKQAAGAPGVSGSWNAVRDNLILANDPRYAWVPLYRRDAGASYAQLFVIPVEVRNRTVFDRSIADAAPDVGGPVAADPANLKPRRVLVTIADGAAGAPDTITFQAHADDANGYRSVAEGCYVVIAVDALGAPNTGLMNGRIYRVGNPVDLTTAPAAPVYELMPGSDFERDLGADGVVSGDDITGLTNAEAFIVGRTRTAAGVFEGPGQDVSIYTTFIKVN